MLKVPDTANKETKMITVLLVSGVEVCSGWRSSWEMAVVWRFARAHNPSTTTRKKPFTACRENSDITATVCQTVLSIQIIKPAQIHSKLLCLKAAQPQHSCNIHLTVLSLLLHTGTPFPKTKQTGVSAIHLIELGYTFISDDQIITLIVESPALLNSYLNLTKWPWLQH